ncbi:MAG: IS21 family transposase, partial [Deltaproteobacteria bacterium]|nr:IS21 family transposase [Deltaproteobacteria bacterium]
CDRKTVREYIMKLQGKGFTRGKDFPRRETLMKAIEDILPKNKKPRKLLDELGKYEEELRRMINDSKEPMRAKTAFEVIQAKYDLKVSYETFKRFAREKDLTKKGRGAMIRIELSPGLETQIDYGKVGFIVDEKTNRRKEVWAFCGILSHSRLPFIQFVYKQNQESFVGSIVDMFEFYGAATEILSMDNLKAGVIKPDLWDPKLNKTCAEMADHYGVFIDPCRVAKATDKGKIERTIPLSRELFRKLKKIYPTANLQYLNTYALQWCRDEYGMREHGTTGIPPLEVFEQTEKAKLRDIPLERYVLSKWKQVSVHPDQFFSFDKRLYSLPAQYRGRRLWVRQKGDIIQVFAHQEIIREYIVSSKKREYIPEDFPEVIREMINGGYPQYLLNQAKPLGQTAYKLIEQVLQPHAYINARRAQGILEIMKRYKHTPFFEKVCLKAVNRRVKLPKTFKEMIKEEENKEHVVYSQETNISQTGKEMLRDISYYVTETKNGGDSWKNIT